MKYLLLLPAFFLTGCYHSPPTYNITGNIGYSSRSGYGGSSDVNSISTGKVSEVWLDTQGGGSVETEATFDPNATAIP